MEIRNNFLIQAGTLPWERVLEIHGTDLDYIKKQFLEAAPFEGKTFWQMENRLAWLDEGAPISSDNNKKLHRTGFFKEMPHGEVDDPSMKSCIDFDFGDYNKETVCRYLNNGVVLVACGGTVPDVLSEGGTVAGCPDLLTDGVWMWPGDLSYYVKRYNLQLDSEFLSFMKQHEYRIDITLDDIDFDSLEFLK